MLPALSGWEFGEVAGGSRGPTGCQRYLASSLQSLKGGYIGDYIGFRD